MLSGSNILMVLPPVLWDVDVRQKSKMAAKLPDIQFAVFTDTHAVKKQYMSYDYTKHLNLQQSYLVSKFKMAVNQPEVVSRKWNISSKFQRLPPGPKKLEVALVPLFPPLSSPSSPLPPSSLPSPFPFPSSSLTFFPSLPSPSMGLGSALAPLGSALAKMF